MKARYPYLFALAFALPLASCRFVGMKPDFSVMEDAFSPVETDTVFVESKPGQSTPLPSYKRPAPPVASTTGNEEEPGWFSSLFSPSEQATPAPVTPPSTAPATPPAASPAPAVDHEPGWFASLFSSSAQPAPRDAAPATVYTVRPGDSLSRIARIHRVPLGSLAAANGIDLQKPLIKPGQQLRIPQGGAAVVPTPRPATTPKPAAAPQPTTAAAQPAAAATAPPAVTPQPVATSQPTLTLQPVTPQPSAAPVAPATSALPAAPAGQYRVGAGDTPYKIARKHGISLQALLQANNLNEESARSLRIGTLLTIPAQPHR